MVARHQILDDLAALFQPSRWDVAIELLAMTSEVIDGRGRGGQAVLMNDTPALDADALAALVDSMPFAAACGIEIVAAGPDEVTARMPWSAERCTTGGLLHGGALMAFADTVGAVCAFLNLPPGAGTSTIESKTNFFRGVRAGAAHSVSRPLHVGRTTIVVQTDITDDDAKRVAQVTQTQAVLAPRA